MTFELVSEATTRGQLRLLATLGDSSLHQNLVLILETCLPHCSYSLCLCRLGSSDCSRRRGIAAPSLHSQGHCLGGAGASPFALHQCHQRGPNPRHSCLQDQKTSFLCGEPKNHGKQIALLIIRARQKTEQPVEIIVTYWYSQNVGLILEGQQAHFGKQIWGKLHKSTSDPAAELQPFWMNWGAGTLLLLGKQLLPGICINGQIPLPVPSWDTGRKLICLTWSDFAAHRGGGFLEACSLMSEIITLLLRCFHRSGVGGSCKEQRMPQWWVWPF